MIKEEEKKVGTVLTVTRKEDGKLAIESMGLATDEMPQLFYALTDMMYRIGTEGCGFTHVETMNNIVDIVLKVARENANRAK